VRIEIKDPWEMPELRDCSEIIEWMRQRLGKHPLAKRKIFPLALHEDRTRAIVEAEEGEPFYAIVDFYQMKGDRLIEKPHVTMLPDRASVQRLIDDTNAEYRKKYA
jgi:hypothetical protein